MENHYQQELSLQLPPMQSMHLPAERMGRKNHKSIIHLLWEKQLKIFSFSAWDGSKSRAKERKEKATFCSEHFTATSFLVFSCPPKVEVYKTWIHCERSLGGRMHQKALSRTIYPQEPSVGTSCWLRVSTQLPSCHTVCVTSIFDIFDIFFLAEVTLTTSCILIIDLNSVPFLLPILHTDAKFVIICLARILAINKTACWRHGKIKTHISFAKLRWEQDSNNRSTSWFPNIASEKAALLLLPSPPHQATAPSKQQVTLPAAQCCTTQLFGLAKRAGAVARCKTR